MTRVLLTAVALAAFPSNSRGEEAAVHLTVRPMPAPKPALKYQLLPELRELKPGNAAQNYLKCFMEQRHFFFTTRGRRRACPLPDDAARRTAGQTSCGSTAARRSGRRTGRPGWMHVDWQTLERIQNGGMETLPDELGPLQDPGGGAPGPVPSRGGRAALRRRDPHRQDDVRAGPPPGRAPHGGRRPGRAVGRPSRPRHAGRDGAAAGMPEPLLGTDRSALSPGGSAQGRAGRPHPGGGGAAVAPRRRPHDGSRDRRSS